MHAFDEADPARLVAGRGGWLGVAALRRLADHPLACIDREFPHYQGAVDEVEGITPPSARHPVFFGCFDWHSAVHSHWCLLRQVRLFDDHPRREDIIAAFERRVTPAHVEAEVAFFEDHPTFERPYGWGWFLRLMVEVLLWDEPVASSLREMLAPLEAHLVTAVDRHVLTRDRPIRVGTHANSAFALSCVFDYARVTDNADLERSVARIATAHYRNDEAYPIAYEPIGYDFLSPTLAEAELMARVLEPTRFQDWLTTFAPELWSDPMASSLAPIHVDAETAGGREMHLVGLNLSRAWSLATVGAVIDDRRRAVGFERLAGEHAAVGLEQAFTEDYAGSHWLTSFVLYLLTRADGGIGPGQRDDPSG